MRMDRKNSVNSGQHSILDKLYDIILIDTGAGLSQNVRLHWRLMRSYW